MKPIPLQPNLPTPTNCFGKPVPASQWYVCPNCKKESPLTKEWVGLTDEAIWLEYQNFWPFHPAEEPTLAKDIAKFARAIEAKLKEKNT